MLRSLITFIAQNKKQKGQGMVEYGLIIALVAVIAIAGLILIGPKLQTMFTNISDKL